MHGPVINELSQGSSTEFWVLIINLQCLVFLLRLNIKITNYNLDVHVSLILFGRYNFPTICYYITHLLRYLKFKNLRFKMSLCYAKTHNIVHLFVQICFYHQQLSQLWPKYKKALDYQHHFWISFLLPEINRDFFSSVFDELWTLTED